MKEMQVYLQEIQIFLPIKLIQIKNTSVVESALSQAFSNINGKNPTCCSLSGSSVAECNKNFKQVLGFGFATFFLGI